jgi:(heptosyl)LPS beta-1,4-glucosyltransferase
MNISAIITIIGNPPHALETIRSVKDLADQIVVVDIGMDSSLTSQIEKLEKVEIQKIEGHIPYIELIREKTKQFATHDYVLFLDPDEIVSEGLKEIIKKELTTYDYFSIPRKNIIFEKWIQNSRWWPDYQIRLFKKDALTWPVEIHSQPVVTGKKLEIEATEENALIHYNYANLDEYLEKMVRYAKAEAHDLKKQGNFTLKQATQKALSEFIGRYFANNGYKDGMHGFVLSFLQMLYYFLVYFYMWESDKYPNVPTVHLVNTADEFFKQGLYETRFWKHKTGVAKSIKEKVTLSVVKRL